MAYRIGLLVAAVLVVAALFLWNQSKTGLSAEELKSLGVVLLPTPIATGTLDLVAHTGEVFDGTALEGKWTFGFFGYTHCPDICPITMASVKQAKSRLEEQNESTILSNIQAMFVSVDAQRDDFEKVRKFVHTIDTDFIGVTGDPEKIEAFATLSGIGYRKMGSKDAVNDYLIEHMGYIVIYDRDGNCFGYIKPPFETDHLVRVFRGLVQNV